MIDIKMKNTAKGSVFLSITKNIKSSIPIEKDNYS